MSSMQLFRSDSPEYAAAFQALLRSTDERTHIKRILIVILKHFAAGENQMFEAFGADRCDLSGIFRQLKTYPEYEVNFVSTPGCFKISTFQETLDIARFMISDRPYGSYSKLPTEEEFQAYVREHFWDEIQQQGGWNCPQQIAIIRRNFFYH